MHFETKFNLNEHVWCMKDNKPTEVVISAIKIFHVNTDQDSLKYSVKNVADSVSGLDLAHTNLFEHLLFKSKNELLKSLFGGASIEHDASKCKGANCNAMAGKGHLEDCIKEHEDCYTEQRT